MLDIKVFAAVFFRILKPRPKNPVPISQWVSAAQFAFNFYLLLPILSYLLYTLYNVFPILAIVEDESKREQAPQNEDRDLETTEAQTTEAPQGIIVRSATKKSSIRKMHRLLRSEGSLYPAMYRFMLLVVAQVILAAILKAVPLVPAFINDAIVTLLTLQLQVNWVCRVVSKSAENANEKPAPSRFPQFRAAFRITAIPALVMCFASSVANSIAVLAVSWLHAAVNQKLTFPFPFYTLTIMTFARNVEVWKIGVYIVVRHAILAVFYVPAAVVLVRVQVSMLPVEYETIVDVDRTFGVEGARKRGHLTAIEAYNSISDGKGWLQLYKMYGKILLIGAGIELFLAVAMVVEYLGVMYFR